MIPGQIQKQTEQALEEELEGTCHPAGCGFLYINLNFKTACQH
jgi:hypothetical protein